MCSHITFPFVLFFSSFFWGLVLLPHFHTPAHISKQKLKKMMKKKSPITRSLSCHPLQILLFAVVVLYLAPLSQQPLYTV